LRQRPIAPLTSGHFSSPCAGLCVDDLLQLGVALVPFRQQMVEIRLAEDASQGGLTNQRRGAHVVEDLDHRLLWADDSEIYDRVDFHGHVVAANWPPGRALPG